MVAPPPWTHRAKSWEWWNRRFLAALLSTNGGSPTDFKTRPGPPSHLNPHRDATLGQIPSHFRDSHPLPVSLSRETALLSPLLCHRIDLSPSQLCIEALFPSLQSFPFSASALFPLCSSPRPTTSASLKP